MVVLTMLLLILSTLVAWPLVLTKAQPYYASHDMTAQLGGSALYVSPGGVIGGQDQLLGYQLVPADQSYNRQLVPADQPYNRQPGASLRQPLLDKLADIFLQQSLPQSTFSVGNAGYRSGQTKDVYQAGYRQSLGTPQESIRVAGQPKSGYSQRQTGGYGKQRKKLKKIHKPVYVPVPIKKQRKKKKKSKTLSVSKGFYVAGGSEVFGKFKSLKSCQKACDNTAHCFAGDYDKWTKRCYMHTNTTACNSLQPHKQITHFKKVPCSAGDFGIDYGRITLGANLDHGLLQKGIKDIQTCIKKCLQAGGGVAGTIGPTVAAPPVIPPAVLEIMGTPQLCFGIDYDFSNHKCYFHTSVTIINEDATMTSPTEVISLQGILGGIVCSSESDDTLPRTPPNLRADPSVINIVICPRPTAP